MLPAVLAVLALVLSSLMLSTQRLSLGAAAAEIARHEARGDSASAAAHLARMSGTVRVERTAQGALHCVTLRTAPARGMLAALEVSATRCAAVSETASP
ncbi:MAG: pilus assembly protein [Microbacteriaceae bacterium]|nr:pilus assembly protein [Microbacteriaceae bacterium]